MGLPNIGPLELIIILAIALLIVGPGRLPEMGSAIGRTIREFRVDTDGLSIGTPLRGFQGILSGAPTYRGDTAPLMHQEASAHALGEGSDGIGNG